MLQLKDFMPVNFLKRKIYRQLQRHAFSHGKV